MCALCHSRADGEKWGASHLRKYKDKPYFLRKEWQPPQRNKVKVKMVEFEVESNSSDGVDLEKFIRAALAGFLWERAETGDQQNDEFYDTDQA